MKIKRERNSVNQCFILIRMNLTNVSFILECPIPNVNAKNIVSKDDSAKTTYNYSEMFYYSCKPGHGLNRNKSDYSIQSAKCTENGTFGLVNQCVIVGMRLYLYSIM